MRAAIYARISDDREETQLGVNRQIEDCEALAQAKGWEIAERYVDNDISAYKGRVRPAYRRMLKDIAQNRIDAVVVYHQDRLHRQPRELEEFFDVCDRAGVRNMATVSGDIDLSTDDGRFHARIMGAVARKSSDDASRRLKRKHLELARSGQWAGGGTRPFGFEPNRVTIQPDEAEIIRELAARFIAGESLRGLCVDLKRRGIVTPTGGRWQPSVLRRMLTSARISGQREHQGEIVATAAWPAIIEPEQRERIRAIVTDPARRATRPARSYLLKGLLRCSDCDAVLVARPRADGARCYVCATGPRFVGCGRRRVLAEPVEEFVLEAVLTALDSPRVAEALSSRRVDAGPEWRQRADNATARLDELAGAYAAGGISMREWMTAREPLQRQLDAARLKLAQDAGMEAAAPWIGRSGELRGKIAGLSVEQRRAVIASVLAHVLVKPGRRGLNRFDPHRFELVWRL